MTWQNTGKMQEKKLLKKVGKKEGKQEGKSREKRDRALHTLSRLAVAKLKSPPVNT